MLKGLRLAFAAASNAGLLPAFGWALLLVALLSIGVGTWAGIRWERGANALDHVDALQALREQDARDYHQLLTTAKGLQEHDVATAIATREAFDRMGALASNLENTLESNRTFTAKQHEALADLSARRPDLGVLRLGDDVLRHWNRSNAGPASDAAAPAAPRPAGQPADAVPAAPAGAQRPGAGPAGQPRRGGVAVPRLPQPDRQPAAGDGRVAAHGLGLVLRGGRWDGPAGAGMPRG